MPALSPQSTVMMGVLTYYVRLLQESQLNADLCTRMRLFISGSLHPLMETFEAFRTVTGTRSWNDTV